MILHALAWTMLGLNAFHAATTVALIAKGLRSLDRRAKLELCVNALWMIWAILGLMQ